MRLFHCDRCGQMVPLSAHRCPGCDAALEYLSEQRANRVLLPTSSGVIVTSDLAVLELDDILDAWRPLNSAVNAIAETLGSPAVYPFEPTGAVFGKLAFVHRQVAAHTKRDRFYAIH